MRSGIFYDSGELKYSGGTRTDPQTGTSTARATEANTTKTARLRRSAYFNAGDYSTAASFIPVADLNP